MEKKERECVLSYNELKVWVGQREIVRQGERETEGEEI